MWFLTCGARLVGEDGNQPWDLVSQPGMRRWLSALLLVPAIASAHAGEVSAGSPSETVVLLHGLGLRSWAMWRLESSLTRAGYRVINLSYPSRTLSLEKLAGEWLPVQLRDRGVTPADRVHFVTHSMGGIVVRMWLRELGMPPNLGRVVMLAPPNAGSEVPDHLKNFPPFRWMTGINGIRLGTEADAVPRTLGAWPAGGAELGIIAGDRSLNPLFSKWLAGPDDGKVAVASTRLDGMRDFAVLHHSHPWLQWRRETLVYVQAFLRDGRFPPRATGKTDVIH